MTIKQNLFSGIQPSGTLTIGNYMGAFKQWLSMQEEYNCIYAIVDLHALTIRNDPQVLQANILDSIALLVSCGISPEKSTIFIQSSVYEHSLLAWILNCHTFVGELSRMTQFKDKSATNKDNINLGLFAYPCLQAADILLYNTSYIPVGEDQKQHIEICRDIANRFNKTYKEIFIIPKAIIPNVGARIMSLQNPSAKMSKSDKNSNSYIGLLDPEDLIIKKLKKSVTDSDSNISFDEKNKPGVSNLLKLFHLATDIPIDKIVEQLANRGYGDLKMQTAEAVIELLKPIQEEYKHLRSDREYLNSIIKEGKEKAQKIASQTISKVYNAIGLLI